MVKSSGVITDEALEAMRHLIETNVAVANYIGGNNNDEQNE